MNTDVLIVGSGCSGLYCALKLPRDIRITLITKSDLESNDSFLAQGGMCMLKEQSDFDSFFEDTLKAGHYENDKESVGIMINSSPEVVRILFHTEQILREMMTAHLPIRERELIHTTELFSMKM